MQTNFVKELRWRGLLQDLIPETESFLLNTSTRGYIGFDPTSDSLHIGSLVQIIILMHFQKAGHHPIVLLGGATGMIGDPSGKSDERNLLNHKILKKNCKHLKTQFEKYLNYYSHLEINFIISFLKIIVLYNNEFTLIAFAFLINSVSGLTYDKIYRNFGNNYLIFFNLINVVLLTIFLFQFGSTLSNLAIIFFSVHLINYFLIKILEIYLKKKI